MSGQKRTTEIQNPHAHSTIWEHFEAVIDNNRNNTTDQPPQKEDGCPFLESSNVAALDD